MELALWPLIQTPPVNFVKMLALIFKNQYTGVISKKMGGNKVIHMVLEKLKARRKEQGFTLVELLIVIVVIAILAAITIVAYGNVTSKANDSGYASDAGSIVSFIETYNADNGSYPTTIASNKISDSGIDAHWPSGIFIVSTTTANKPTSNVASSTATCTTAATSWAECSNSTGKYYQVVLCTTGANVYYPNLTGSSPGVQTKTAGAGC